MLKVDCVGKCYEFFVDNIVLGNEGNLILIRFRIEEFLNLKILMYDFIYLFFVDICSLLLFDFFYYN